MFKVLVVFMMFPVFSFSQLSRIELEAKTVPEPLMQDTTVNNWNQAQPGYDKLPAESKELLYWTNYSRNNPKKFWDSAVVPILAAFPALNRSEAYSLKADLLMAGPLPMFILNDRLINTAQGHASDIALKRAAVSHTSTDGTDFGTRMKRASIKKCANENISLSGQTILLSVVLLYLDINLPGLGHRKTLLDRNLREIGVGSFPYNKNQYFLVQDFACAQQ
jgi:hypothetical protein